MGAAGPAEGEAARAAEGEAAGAAEGEAVGAAKDTQGAAPAGQTAVLWRQKGNSTAPDPGGGSSTLVALPYPSQGERGREAAGAAKETLGAELIGQAVVQWRPTGQAAEQWRPMGSSTEPDPGGGPSTLTTLPCPTEGERGKESHNQVAPQTLHIHVLC